MRLKWCVFQSILTLRIILMVLPKPANPCRSEPDQFKRKFTRRKDLTIDIRLAIANMALSAQLLGEWGTITDLAREYEISRTFVYSLASTLKEAAPMLFGEAAGFIDSLSTRELSIQAMLSLRLEGRSSIGATSTIMERFGWSLSSTGSISQILSRIGALLPMTLSTQDSLIRYLVFTSDEIFSKTTPILVTVDPISSAILRIELADSRKAEDWKKHFECLYENGWEAIYLVTDEGTGLRAGHAEALSEVVRQSDTYHAIAHQLGQWPNRLEDLAYQAIATEQECERKWDSAKSDREQEERLEAYEQAAEAAEKAIRLYEDFCYLYRCVLRELDVFDANGNLRNRQQAEEQIKAGLMLIEDLGRNKITKAAGKIKRVLPELLHYLEIAKEVVDECKELSTDEEALKAICIAWQWGKAVRKAKKSDRKKRAAEQERFCLEIAEGLLQEEEEQNDLQEKVYSKLDGIVQSSALVECINSIIRPYLNNTKNHVTQELLNLIMHYHNHRRYRDGKRKNKTPMEILTGQEQGKDWIEIVFGIIREKDPELLLAA